MPFLTNRMKTYNTETLIIGAGPAGLACALKLSEKNKKFIIIEKDSVVGGLSKTYKFEEGDGSVFFTDNGPHRFFSKNPYLYEFIGDILGNDWIKVKRYTRQYIDGKYYDYPINPIQALKNIGPIKAFLILTDYFIAKIKFGLFKMPINNFKDYIEANFGKRLGEFSMINYTEKIWGIKADTIHQDWAGQRIKGLDLKQIIFDFVKKLFNKKDNDTASLIDEFYYPVNGSSQIYQNIVDKLILKKYDIFFLTEVTSVNKTNDGFETELIINNEKCLIKSKFLVESVPVTQFIKLLKPIPPEVIFDALKNFKYRSQVYLFITLDKESLTKDQWIYLPKKEIPFARVSEMRNFSDKLSPIGKTSLFIEFFCTENDNIWNMNKDELLNISLPHLEKMKLFSKHEIRQTYLIKQKYVYPIYDINYKEYMEKTISFIDSIENLFAIGRPGRFRYNNQDHSLEMGILAAKCIIDNKRYDFDSIGNEKDYYEKGDIITKIK